MHPSGYYAWLKEPLSQRDHQDKRLSTQIKQYWLESGGLSGYRNVHQDLLEASISCGRDRVLRIMRQEGIRAQRGYKAPKAYSAVSHIRRLQTCLIGSLTSQRRTAGGSAISLTSIPKKVFFWLWLWTCLLVTLWAGQWVQESLTTWFLMR